MKTGKVDSSEVAAERIRQAKERQQGQGAGKGSAEEVQALRQQEGTVDLTLGKAIQELLKAENFEAERSAKKERLKALIEAGEYNPRSEDIAQSLATEIGLEIAVARTSTEE